MAAGGWRWTWPVAGSAGAGRTRSVARSPGRWRRCTRAACACTCWPRMRRATSGCRRWPESERPARERCRAAAARRARAAGAAMVAAGAWLVGAGRGRAAAGCGLGPVALAQGAPPTPGRTPVRRHRRGSGEPGGAGGGDFGPAAAGGAPDRTGCGYARRRGLARRARPRPAAGRLCPGPGRAAARRRLPPHGRCAGARSAAHACTPAFHRLDAASMSAAVLADIAALVPGFAWPWLLLAVPLPWLVRWLLPPVRSALPALRVPWGGRLDAIAHGGGAPDVRRMPWLAWLAWTLLCVAAARPQVPGEVVQPPASGRDLMLAVDLSGSMGEEDMRVGGRTVDRLTAAKAVLADFLARREGDRVGLIVFGQRAYALV